MDGRKCVNDEKRFEKLQSLTQNKINVNILSYIISPERKVDMSTSQP